MMTDFFFILENDPNYPIENESNRQNQIWLFSGPLLHTNRVPDSNGVSKFLIPFFFYIRWSDKQQMGFIWSLNTLISNPNERYYAAC